MEQQVQAVCLVADAKHARVGEGGFFMAGILVFKSRSIVVQLSAGVVQLSFRKENLFSFRLVDESVGESIDFLAGDGKRSRYTFSPDDGLEE